MEEKGQRGKEEQLCECRTAQETLRSSAGSWPPGNEEERAKEKVGRGNGALNGAVDAGQGGLEGNESGCPTLGATASPKASIYLVYIGSRYLISQSVTVCGCRDHMHASLSFHVPCLTARAISNPTENYFIHCSPFPKFPLLAPPPTC